MIWFFFKSRQVVLIYKLHSKANPCIFYQTTFTLSFEEEIY